MGKVIKALDQSLIICWCNFTVGLCDTAKSPSFFWKPVAIPSLSAVQTDLLETQTALTKHHAV